MIFPDKSLEEWLKKHPELKVFNLGECRCGSKSSSTRPFITNSWFGILVEDCGCGQGPRKLVINRKKKLWNSEKAKRIGQRS